MADEPDDVLDLDEGMVLDPDEDEQQQDDDQDDDEAEVTFSDDAAVAEPEPTDLVKHLRKELRKRDEQLAQTRKAPVEEAEIVVGPIPKVEDFDYDSDAHEAAVAKWVQLGRDKEKQDDRRQQQERQKGEAWEAVKKNYNDKKAALPFRDKEQMESKAFEALNPMQQAVIAKVAPDPALFIYGAAKNDARLNSLAAIDDPIVLAHAIGRMGAGLKIGKRSQAPEPERVIRGSTVRGGTDKQLEKLEKEADRTGDRTALVKYKKSLNA